MNLCIDIGNSTSKVGIFKNNELNNCFLFENIIKTNEIEQICNDYAINACIVSSTASDNFEIINFLNDKKYFVIELNEKTKIPITNRYITPQTLGNDRLAAVVGANFLLPDTDILVIDAGTALTFDFIDAEKNYYGGAIAPGLAMRFRALNEFTGRLPLVQIADNQKFELIGNDTQTSIISGVVNGIIYEIEGYKNFLIKKYPTLAVVLTGGNSEFLAKRLQNKIHLEKSLVLIGLNQILEMNVKNKLPHKKKYIE
ncbi:MAG: type III pantothenate kinase [Paludibacter sp.]|nr:type III pantothenate kinase [Paludibacter sp.]